MPSSSATSPAQPDQDLRSTTQDFTQYHDLTLVDRHLTGLSTDLVLKSLNVFVNKYPELAILHLPSFAKKHQSQDTKEIKTLLAALLAITRSHPLLITFPWESSLLRKERYAEYARDRLSKSSFEAPRLEVAQALLIMTVYEWGTREFHRAWIYCGEYQTDLPRVSSKLMSTRHRDENNAGIEQFPDRTLSTRFIPKPA